MNARKGWITLVLFGLPFFFASSLHCQSQSQSQKPKQNSDSMSGMNMSKMGQMEHDTAANPDAARSANDSMSHERMEMNAHMFMTDLRPAVAGDQQRAEQILETVRASIEKYRDYKAALADGYQIFLPNVPLPQYHFTNWRYAFEAQFAFNPAHPTSLLYKKTRDGYQLLGAMFTAPKRATDEQLNERVPLSVTRWHKHVNFCMPQPGTPWGQTDWKKFGMAGSIATEEACNAAGGRWTPQIFGWMVHVYPFEKDPEKIWAH
jgi:hypothetical protein